MRWSSSVQELMSQSGSGQHHRRLCHTRRVGRPKSGRSTRSIRARTFTRATTPHDGQPTDRPVVSTWILPRPPGPSSTPRNTISGSPIIQRIARVGSASTGVHLHLGLRTTSDWWTPATRSRIRLLHPAHFRRAHMAWLSGAVTEVPRQPVHPLQRSHGQLVRSKSVRSSVHRRGL